MFCMQANRLFVRPWGDEVEELMCDATCRIEHTVVQSQRAHKPPLASCQLLSSNFDHQRDAVHPQHYQLPTLNTSVSLSIHSAFL